MELIRFIAPIRSVQLDVCEVPSIDDFVVNHCLNEQSIYFFQELVLFRALLELHVDNSGLVGVAESAETVEFYSQLLVYSFHFNNLSNFGFYFSHGFSSSLHLSRLAKIKHHKRDV